jgi:hypothetical protein
MSGVRAWVACVAAVVGLSSAGRAQVQESSRLDGVTAYVENYYGRAQSLIAEEMVALELLKPDLTADGFPRRLLYEIRVEWDPEGDSPRASVVRELLQVGRRTPKPGTKPECLDPKGITPEPLAFLLRDRRERYVFREVGASVVGGHNAVMIDYRPSGRDEPTITGTKECINIDMPDRTRGRLWVDRDTSAVLRLDEYIVGVTDVRVPRELQSTGGWGLFVRVDRVDSTTRYEPVTFTGPDETLLLPTSIETVSVIQATGIQRLRVRQTYRNYRRFLTGSRLVP